MTEVEEKDVQAFTELQGRIMEYDEKQKFVRPPPLPTRHNMSMTIAIPLFHTVDLNVAPPKCPLTSRLSMATQAQQQLHTATQLTRRAILTVSELEKLSDNTACYEAVGKACVFFRER